MISLLNVLFVLTFSGRVPGLLYFFFVSGMVHTRGESLQDGLGYVRTCGTILASAYVLCYLPTAWLQFLI